MSDPLVHHTGSNVTVTYRGRVVKGTVVLGTSNGRSLMLSFDAMLGGYVGMMPVLWDDARAEFLGVVCGEPVKVDRR